MVLMLTLITDKYLNLRIVSYFFNFFFVLTSNFDHALILGDFINKKNY